MDDSFEINGRFYSVAVKERQEEKSDEICIFVSDQNIRMEKMSFAAYWLPDLINVLQKAKTVANCSIQMSPIAVPVEIPLETGGVAVDELIDALAEASLEIEYLHDKFMPTGTGNMVLNKVRHTLNKLEKQDK